MNDYVESNQSAFPVAYSDYHEGQLGLTKREYFAAMALQGLLDWDAEMKATDVHKLPAQHAVAYADALIEALNKEAK